MMRKSDCENVPIRFVLLLFLSVISEMHNKRWHIYTKTSSSMKNLLSVVGVLVDVAAAVCGQIYKEYNSCFYQTPSTFLGLSPTPS